MSAHPAAIKRNVITMLKVRRETQLPPTPQKIKIKVRPYTPGAKPAPKQKEDPARPEKIKRRKGLIGKVVEIIINDIKTLPSRIVHGKKVVKKVKMPESNESWKDWEGEV
jgi:hypothetical protein